MTQALQAKPETHASTAVKWSAIAGCGLIAVKPVIDLGWNASLGTVLGQSINLQTLAAIGVLGLAGVTLLLSRTPRTGLERAALVFALVATVSFVVGLSTRGVDDLLRLFCALAAIFVAIAGLTSLRRLHLFFRVYIAATAVPVALAMLQSVGVLPYQRVEWQEDQFVGRASGLYEHPINLALFLLTAIPIALYLLAVVERRAEKVVYGAFLVGALAALVLTTHRASLFAGVLIIAGWLVLTRRPRLLLACALALIAAVIVLRSKITDLLVAGFEGSSFLRGRGDIWSAFVQSWLDGGPITWVLGDGYAYARSDVPLLGEMYSTEPHNDFLRMLVTYGVVGLVAYVALIVVLVMLGLRLLKHEDRHSALIGRALVLSTVAIAIVSMTAEPFRYPSGVWMLLVLGAYAASKADTGRAGQGRPRKLWRAGRSADDSTVLTPGS